MIYFLELSPTSLSTDESVTEEISPKDDRPPDFLQPIKGMSVQSGDTALFECKVEGIPKPQLYWYFNNRKIRSSRFVQISEDKDSAKLQIKNIKPFDSGKYTIRAINRAGVKSSTATLTVKGMI